VTDLITVTNLSKGLLPAQEFASIDLFDSCQLSKDWLVSTRSTRNST